VRETLGKLGARPLERLIAIGLGAAREDVRVGPGIGRDCAIVRIGAGRVMAITTDPLSVIPALGFEASARLSCHLLASDLWTSGIAPTHATVDLNLPPQMGDDDLDRYWSAMSATWESLGVAVVAGHTGRYPGCDYSIVGAATLIGLGDEDRALTPAMARPGDRVIVTKGCAIEAAAIAAHLFPLRLAARLDEDGLRRARALIDSVSVVEDCRAVLRAGAGDRGVTALHDATEGGVLGGLIELARACGHDLRIERAKIPLAPECRAACEAFEIDPYWALAEGALIAAVRQPSASGVMAALDGAGIAAAEVGEVVAGAGALLLTERDGEVRTFTEPEPDPYWDAYARAVREGWS
jgi:hydrogenase expression/formation protein HypE